MPMGRRTSSMLTAAKVKTASPGKHHDGGGTGLILLVKNNGSRFWVQRITIHGKRREIGLGSPSLISLAEARELAMSNKRLVRLGGDPLAEKRKANENISFAHAVEQFLTSKLGEFRNEKHRKQWRSTLDNYAKPKIGNMMVRAVTTSDVLRVLEPIWTEKTETASRLRGRIEAVLSWATVAGFREGDNPARWAGNLKELLPRPSKLSGTENQPALSLSDVPRWWAALRKRDGMAARALEFLSLTAARSGEIRGATWEEFDFSGMDLKNTSAATLATSATWTIPASRMKAGREHRVPLSVAAVEILKNLPRIQNNPYVFVAVRGGMLSDMAISAVMRRMHEAEEKSQNIGYFDSRSKRPAVPHGLRSTFRQWAAEQGYPRDLAEIALAHFIGSEVERAYQRSDMLNRRREMMEAWASCLHGERLSTTHLLVNEAAV